MPHRVLLLLLLLLLVLLLYYKLSGSRDKSDCDETPSFLTQGFAPERRKPVLHGAGRSAIHGRPSIIERGASDDKLKTVANFC